MKAHRYVPAAKTARKSIAAKRSSAIARIRSRKVVMAHLGRVGRIRKKIPAQAQPDSIRLSYYRALLALMRDLKAIALGNLLPEMPSLLRAAAAARGDSINSVRFDAGPGRRIQAIIEAAANQWQAKHPDAELADLATRYGNATSRHNRHELGKQMKAAVGVDAFAREPNLAPRIELFAAENVSLITSMATNTFSDVEKYAVAALRDGDRAESLAGDLEERFGVSESKAKLIAKDQIGKLNGELNQVRQEALGVTGYTWRTMGDNRVREEHMALEGQHFDWDDPPSEGIPGYAINCFPGNVMVSPSALVEKLYRRRYRGHLTEIVSDQGKTLRCTPNHPILTSRGWVAAHLVQVGDHIVETSLEVGEMLVEDLERAETQFVELFRAAQDVGTESLRDVGGAWFHGDVTDQEVHVVGVDWGLGDELPAELSQGFCNDALSLADKPGASLGPGAQLFGASLLSAHSSVRGGCKLLAGIWGQHGVPYKHPLALVSWLDALADKFAADGRAANVKLLRELLDAGSLAVEGRKHVARILFGVVGRSVMSTSGFNPARPELDAEGVAIHAKAGGSFGDRGSLVHKPLRVVEKRLSKDPFDGHVFNLQTATGWYVAESAIVHNCRCFAEPDVSDFLDQLSESDAGDEP